MSKTEQQNVSLDIFVFDTSIARNNDLPGLEKKHFSLETKNVFFILKKLKDPYSLFGSDISYLSCSKSKSLITDSQRYLH